MSLWKDSSAKPSPAPTPVPSVASISAFDAREPVSAEPTVRGEPASTLATRSEPATPRKESLIASDISIEGKIEGSGSVRIAGAFKGDVTVQGDLLIESGAKVTGSVRADKVVVAGELEGNIENAARVDLQPGGAITGDVKAGSLTVAAGARMRGQAVFGWDDGAAPKSSKPTSKAE
jgi:cytoskeletal protein CcmA (bactofilin family)